MSDYLLYPGREVCYLRSHTQQWVSATIVGPSAKGADCIALKYMRGGHEFENPAAPLSAVELHARSPSPPSRSPSPSGASRAWSRSRSPSASLLPSPLPPPSQSSRSPSCEEVSLPPGWERRQTPEGKFFYINHDKRETTWNPPPPSYDACFGQAEAKPRSKPAGRKAQPRSNLMQKTLVAFLQADHPPAKRPCLDEPPTPAEIDCSTPMSTRRRTRAEVAADPRKKAPDARFKLRVVEYSKAYGVRRAAEKFKVSPGSISGSRG